MSEDRPSYMYWQDRLAYASPFLKKEGGQLNREDWHHGYFLAAKKTIQEITSPSRGDFSFAGPRHIWPEEMLPAGLFLFRHYLELSLKYILLRLHRLTDDGRNLSPEEIKDVMLGHDLETLWTNILKGRAGRIPDESWDVLDIAFLDACIRDFNSGNRNWVYRYPDERISTREPQGQPVVDLANLLPIMEHARKVIEGIAGFSDAKHDMNSEYARLLGEMWHDIGGDY